MRLLYDHDELAPTDLRQMRPGAVFQMLEEERPTGIYLGKAMTGALQVVLCGAVPTLLRLPDIETPCWAFPEGRLRVAITGLGEEVATGAIGMAMFELKKGLLWRIGDEPRSGTRSHLVSLRNLDLTTREIGARVVTGFQLLWQPARGELDPTLLWAPQ